MNTTYVRFSLLVAFLASACGHPAPGVDQSTDTVRETTPTFTLKLRVDFDDNCPEPTCRTCSPSDPAADCSGNVYWWLNSAEYIQVYKSVIAAASRGTEIVVSGIPLAPQMGIRAFMDDNGNANALSPMIDKGDFAFTSSWKPPLELFIPVAGQLTTFTILFQSRVF